jgi:hypothetical protein
VNVRALLFALTAGSLAAPAAAHVVECAKLRGVDKARCERHEGMFRKCGPLKDEAHHACDREFLLANPLNCGALQGNDAERCGKEVAAFKACESNAGAEFMRCVRNTAGESPMGH